MKFNLSKQILLEGLQTVIGVVPSRPALSILSNIKIVAKNNELTLMATDMDISISVIIPAAIEREGAATLPAKVLFNIVKGVSNNEISIELDDNHNARLSCGSFDGSLMGTSAEDFPEFPSSEGLEPIILEQLHIKNGLQRTEYCSAVNDTRHALNGVSMQLSNGALTFAATDGRRLAVQTNSVEGLGSLNFEYIIPQKTISELGKIVGDNGKITLKYGNNIVFFEAGSLILTSRLIEGTYPKYQQVIPTSYKTRISLPRQTFLEKINLVSLVANEDKQSTPVVRLVLKPGELEVSAQGANVGHTHERIAIEYAGEELTIAFNPEYLKAPLRSLNCESVNFDLTDSRTPGVIRYQDEFLCVLMPVRS